MKPRQKKSRRRSDANSSAERRLKAVVLYVDESLHSKVSIREMQAAGATVRHAGDAFKFGTPDEVWLDGCGRNGWIVLTRDQRIRFRLLIGATTAVFSLFHEILLRPLPVPEPERLVNLGAPGPHLGSTSCSIAGDCQHIFSFPMFRDLQAEQTVLTGIAIS